jgi:hypothetical protein
VAELLMELHQQEPSTSIAAEFQSVVADAMDCAYKQAISAPQTRGSRFARKAG